MTFILWCLGIYAALLALSAIILALFFWYEATNHPCPHIPPPPYKPLPVALTIIRYFLFHFIRPAILIGWLLMPKKQPATSPHPPLILVHGIFSTRTSWYFFYKALAKEKFHIGAFGYPTLWGSMEATIERLETFVQKTLEETGSPKVSIVAHSLGGVVVRYWLAKYPHNHDNLAGLITLCTPHSGSNVSRLLPNPFSKALNPDSEVIRTITGQSYTTFPCVAHATTTDLLVMPAKRLLPPKNWALRLARDVDHLEILADTKTIAAVISDLKGESAPEAASMKTGEH